MKFPKRGDIYWVNLDPTIGAEIKKTRPCVVISPDSANRVGSLIIVAPIAKAEGNKTYFHEIFLPKGTANLNHPSKIKVFQLRCIDKKRLSQHSFGSLPAERITVLDEKIRIVTGVY
ncbi:PemK-like protein [Desulfosarcina variabilis str. Montpellier]|uniref:type II toxin-antitoxin system PemK/MazF family toxin n=1 Tax=Desulfosarcina variabilis TaxID=2300 RepID=UPI003AFA0D96